MQSFASPFYKKTYSGVYDILGEKDCMGHLYMYIFFTCAGVCQMTSCGNPGGFLDGRKGLRQLISWFSIKTQ